MQRLVLFLLFLVVLSGCSVRKDFYATGGSRADGTIDMAYDFRQFESAVVDHNQARKIAIRKCKVWGYDSAEPFGGKVENCHARNGYGNCVQGQVVVTYQCHGNLSAPAAVTPVASSLQPVSVAAEPGLMSKGEYRQMKIKTLMEKNLPYEEYVRQYRAIMAE